MLQPSLQRVVEASPKWYQPNDMVRCQERLLWLFHLFHKTRHPSLTPLDATTVQYTSLYRLSQDLSTPEQPSPEQRGAVRLFLDTICAYWATVQHQADGGSGSPSALLTSSHAAIVAARRLVATSVQPSRGRFEVDSLPEDALHVIMELLPLHQWISLAAINKSVRLGGVGRCYSCRGVR